MIDHLANEKAVLATLSAIQTKSSAKALWVVIDRLL
jgi:hypothetical protein